MQSLRGVTVRVEILSGTRDTDTAQVLHKVIVRDIMGWDSSICRRLEEAVEGIDGIANCRAHPAWGKMTITIQASLGELAHQRAISEAGMRIQATMGGDGEVINPDPLVAE